MSEVALKVTMACEVGCVSAAALLPLHAVHLAALRSTSSPSRQTDPAAQPLKVQGCVGAVRRVAEKLPGVQSVDIDLPAQKVVVRGANLDAAAVKAGVAKSGKATEFWQ